MGHNSEGPPLRQMSSSNGMYVPSVAYIVSIILAYCPSTFLRFSFLVGVSWSYSSEKLVGKMQNFWILKALFGTSFPLRFVLLIAPLIVSIHFSSFIAPLIVVTLGFTNFA